MDQFDTLRDSLAPLLSLFGDNPYLQALAVILLGSVTATLVNKIVGWLIQRLSSGTNEQWYRFVISNIRGPITVSVLLIAITIAARMTLSDAITPAIASLLTTVAILVWSKFFIQLSRLVIHHMSDRTDRFQFIRGQTVPLFDNLALIIIIDAAIYFIFNAWNIDMTAWLASAGIAGIAIGFAAKDTLANLFSGVFILADAPYKIGDYVVLDSGERGAITHIGIRSTRMLTRDDVEITIPNSVIGNSKIINESGGPHTKYRIRFEPRAPKTIYHLRAKLTLQ